jgi:uncharacterized protein YcaQ
MLAWQGLYPPRSWKGKRGVKSFFQRVRSIQFDPINVVGRNPDLVLQSRVEDYSPSLLEGMLYKERVLVDSWDKKANISLTEDWPYFSRYRASIGKMLGVSPDLVKELAPAILDQIAREGPQSSLEFKIDKKTDWAWGPTRAIKAGLEVLYKQGLLGVHHRVSSRRYFDLIENLLPAQLLKAPDPNQDLEAYYRWHVLRRISAMGLAHPNAGDQWGGMLDLKTSRRREILQELVAAGELVMIEVDELTGEGFYMRGEDFSLIQGSLKDQPVKKAAFIAPLDNLLWDRKTIKRLFDFRYVWEVYKPESKREYGFFVLPVLYGDEIVGRFDPIFNREKAQLHIKDWWWEKGVQVDQEMAQALKECMSRFLIYLNGHEIKYSQTLLKKGHLDWLREI